MARQLMQNRPAIFEEVPSRVLAIYAHPDDAEVACGGSLAKWSRLGARVERVVCTDGGKGTRSVEVSADELVVLRATESAAGASRLGVAAEHHLGYRDGELRDDLELQARLVGLVRRVRPDVVLCPDPTALLFGEHYVNHRDHRVLGTAVLDACFPAAALPLYFPETGEVHQVGTALLSGTLEPSVWVDVGEDLEEKIAALAFHRSQFEDDGTNAAVVLRRRAEEEGRRCGVRHAEGFRRIRGGG